MQHETIRFDITDKVATITLNRPDARNALSARMRREIASVVAQLRAGEDGKDLDVRALVLQGAGGAFCAGGDVKAMTTPRSAAEIRHRIVDAHGWYDDLMNLEMPVIAAVRGPAYGAGLSLALAADFVLASPKASFCAVFARMGLIPDLGLLHVLPRLVGLQRAKEMVFSARPYGAQEARAIGLVHDIVEDAALDAAAQALARQFTHASMAAIGIAKVLLNRSFETDCKTMGELEASGQGAAANTPAHHEAVARFLAKQPLAYAGFARADWARGEPAGTS
ncbi:enoyl-CoA hydratase/isomerase family protein [Pseudorhodoferax sp.]|uniref:enoyl-CoA hydratase/isomerase family protein n=1 Tax=Pseudorhodoferax sp. TaxID=1993553 RepID=UPI002DD62951|nr:enoyl-CoA hydratase/isomerase family protein [Pseudorhodoferax sp.]